MATRTAIAFWTAEFVLVGLLCSRPADGQSIVMDSGQATPTPIQTYTDGFTGETISFNRGKPTTPLAVKSEWLKGVQKRYVNKAETKLAQVDHKTSATEWRWSQAAEHHNAVVKVQAGRSGGTGWILDTTSDSDVYVVTNHHVIEGQQFARVENKMLRGGGSIVASSQSLDLALIRIPNAKAPHSLPVWGDVVSPGNEVEVVGVGGPDGKLLRPMIGKAMTGNRVDLAVVSGDSGAPMIYEGGVCGVNWGATGQIKYARADSRGSAWNMVHPAESRVNGPELAQWLTQYCRPWQPRIIGGGGNAQFYPPQGGAIIQQPAQCPPGQPGKDGKDGRGIASLGIQDGILIVQYTDGQTEAVGQLPKGRDGTDGKDGKDGAPGAPGRDATEVDPEELAAKIQPLLDPIPIYLIHSESNQVLDRTSARPGERVGVDPWYVLEKQRANQ